MAEIPLIKQAIKKLPKRTQRIIKLRFFDGLTFREIAKKEGISHQRVGQILFGEKRKHKRKKGAIQKIREILKIS